MFSMFGRTKRGAAGDRMKTAHFLAFKSSLGAARHSLAYMSWFTNSESRISNHVIAAKLHTV